MDRHDDECQPREEQYDKPNGEIEDIMVEKLLLLYGALYLHLEQNTHHVPPPEIAYELHDVRYRQQQCLNNNGRRGVQNGKNFRVIHSECSLTD